MGLEQVFDRDSCEPQGSLDENMLGLHARLELGSEACRVNEELGSQFNYEIVDDASGNYQINIENADGRKVALEEFGTEIAGISIINDYIVGSLKNKGFVRFDTIGFMTINTVLLTREPDSPGIPTALYTPGEINELIKKIDTKLEQIK